MTNTTLQDSSLFFASQATVSMHKKAAFPHHESHTKLHCKHPSPTQVPAAVSAVPG